MKRGPSIATLRWRRENDARMAAIIGPPSAEWPVGSEAVVTDDFGMEWNTVTRSKPWTIGAGDAVRHLVLIDGISGGYDVERVNLRPHDPMLKHFGERGGPAAIPPRKP